VLRFSLCKSKVNWLTLDVEMLEEIQQIVELATQKFYKTSQEEKARNDNLQLDLIQKSLKQWSEQINLEIRRYSRVSSGERAVLAIEDSITDQRDRQSKCVIEMREDHKKQLDVLNRALAQEQVDSLHLQQMLEKDLREKYESMMTLCQNKIQLDQESSFQVSSVS